MPLPPRKPEKKLNPEVERLAYQLKVIGQEAEGLVVGMTDDQLKWRPRQDAWSVSECFAHLNLANRRMAEEIEKSVTYGRQANLLSDGPFTYGFLSRMFHRMLEPPVRRKFKAAGRFRPASNLEWAQIQADWQTTHDRIEDLLYQANGLDLARVKVQSPASRWVSYPLGIAFWIHTAHDRRHLWQARQIVNDARFPKVAAGNQQV
jgi:DinB superfamily